MWETKMDAFIDIGNGSARLSEIAAATTNTYGTIVLTLKSGGKIETKLNLDEWITRLRAAVDASY